MSAALARLKKRAAELEQKKQFDKALDVYLQILEEGGRELSDDDVPLYNRVGDMLMRKGSVTEALGYYERAVDVYAERGFLNNAIALCSKILRQSPGRTAVYYKLGRISARKGFKSDARKNFLEYADRMQKAGMADEAFRALKEFASLYPDQDDVRLILAELLSKENRKGEALEQLQTLYEKLEAEGRKVEARATIDRMRAIDPNVEPRPTGSQPTQQAPDLVFLDLSEEIHPRPGPVPDRTPSPPVERVPPPLAVAALDGLTLTFVPDEDGADDEDVLRPGGFEATVVEEPGEDAVAGAARVEGLFDGSTPPEPVEPLDGLEPTSVEADNEDDLVAPLREAPPLSGSEFGDIDLAEVRRPPPPRAHDLSLPGDLPATPEQVMLIGATPTSVASQDDALLAANDEADLAADLAAREAVHRPPHGEHSPTPVASGAVEAMPDDDLEGLMFGAADTDADTVEEDAVGGLGAGDKVSIGELEAVGFATGEDDDNAPDQVAGGDDEAPVALPDAGDEEPAFPDIHDLAEAPGEETASVGAADTGGDAGWVEEPEPEALGLMAPPDPDDFMSVAPSFGAGMGSGSHAFPPLVGLDANAEDGPGDVEAGPLPPRLHTPRTTLSIGGAEQHLRRRLELEPENWALRRQLGEALLDMGNRDAGMYELELAMVGYELDDDVDRASEVADEILGIFPGSIRHHQKRVEYAVRARDRGRLIHAYLELADGLFRTGAGDKAVSVYGRVLELDGSNERAEFALATLAPDELIRRRGGVARPERWSEELAAIPGSGIGRTSGPSAAVATPGSPVSIEAVMEVVSAATDEFPVEYATPPAATGDDADGAGDAMPDEPEPGDAGAVVAMEDASWAMGEPETGPEAAAEDWPHGIDEAPASVTESWAEPESVAEESAPAGESGSESWAEPESVAGESAPAGESGSESWAEPESVAEESAATGEPGSESWAEPESVPDAAAAVEPDEASSGRDNPIPEPSGIEVAADAAVEDLDSPADPGEEPPGIEDSAAEEPPVAEPDERPETGPPARPPTPQSTQPVSPTPHGGMSRLERARRLTPVGLGDDSFVDLGEWLRLTEPTKSTRMLVEDPQPTGDEQADFEELLRRFKRGVAENVEAEDYEAHYDLGVAYKEMGLVDEAIAQFQKSLRGTTHRVRSYEALGQCFVEKEQFPIAVALLQRATELPGTDDQQLVGVLYLLGFALEHMGRAADALPYYLRVFAVDIEFRDIAARVAAMGNLTT